MITPGENKILEVPWNVPIFADTVCIMGNAGEKEGEIGLKEEDEDISAAHELTRGITDNMERGEVTACFDI